MFVDGMYCPVCEAENELIAFKDIVGDKEITPKSSSNKPKMINSEDRKRLEREIADFVWKQSKEQSDVQDCFRKSDEDLMDEFLAEEG